MPLPTVTLDDRRFQDIVDQAKSMIPHYCPEWTDHNVSDPGVTLIELFAWMTDLLLYRVNQVPDKMYVKFLEMIGVRLDPPRAASAPLTFYLSAPQPADLVIGENTEVATIRTETTPAIIFTTERDLVIRPPKLVGAFIRDIDRAEADQWEEHDLTTIDLPGQSLRIFTGDPNPGDAFYLAFAQDLSHHVLALTMDNEYAGGRGIDPNDPPIEWEVWQGGASRWAHCDVELDSTGGFNMTGEIVLHLPHMAKVEFRNLQAFWLRCRNVDKGEHNKYEESPEISRLRIESIGISGPARHAITVLNEEVGISDGTPGQVFKLLYTPILSRDPKRDVLLVTPADNGKGEPWIEVTDFGDSTADDPHFTLDGADGTLTLGPALMQPDGQMYRFGRTPSKGSRLRFARYQHGGGTIGNVPRGMLTVLKSSIPYVARVTNRKTAVGGRDAQTVEDAKLRAPQSLRTRTRAVTADDFEFLAKQVPGVERAHCVTPKAQPGREGEPAPGEVIVGVLPQVESRERHIKPEQLELSSELKLGVESYLNERRLLGTRLQVVQPQYIWVSIEAKVRFPANAEAGLIAETRREAEDELYRYLNPYTGGPAGTGWPFGRELHVSELFARLQRIPAVEFVDELRILVRDAPGAPPLQAEQRLAVPPLGVICSDVHTVSRK
jgi:predicted phage baseplate assembly protein